MMARLRTSSQLRRLVNVGGALLLILSIWLLVDTIEDVDPAALLGSLGPSAAIKLVGFGAGYGVLLLLLVAAWRSSLFGAPLTAAAALAVYGTSILPKYLPGSVLQYGARQLLGGREDLPQRAVAAASTLEVGLHLAIPSVLLVPAYLFGPITGLLAGVGLAACLAFTAIQLPEGVWRGRAQAAVLQTLFFTGMAILVGGLAWTLGAEASLAAVLARAFLLAWLAGFVAPIAPGGLGVREAAIAASVAPFATAEITILFAAATRIATLVGDLAVGGAGLLALGHLRREPASGSRVGS